MKVPTTRSTTVQSVDRALDLLEALAEAREGMPLMALSNQVGLNASTCHHLLATLVQRGYITQDPRTRDYLLGNQVYRLQHARSQQMNLAAEAMPILRELNQVTGEAVHLAVLTARELVTMAKLESLHALKVDNGFVGKSNAAHATATGKAILGCLSESELDAIVAARGLQAFTNRTITDPAALKADLLRVRQRGYAIDDEEFQPGVFCVGAAVRDHTGEVVASISCSAPQIRVTSQAVVDRTAALTCEAARRLSIKLGYSS